MKNSNFQLINKPKLVSLAFEVNEEFDFERNEELSIEVNSDIKVYKNTEYNKHDAIVELTFSVFKEYDFSEVPFTIDIKIKGMFAWNEALEANESLLKNMLERNAPAILYSYIRPIVTMMTVEADVPPLVIPLVNFYG